MASFISRLYGNYPTLSGFFLFFTLFMTDGDAQSLFREGTNPFPEDRNTDVLHYRIELDMKLDQQGADGLTTITTRFLSSGDSTVWFHAAGLHIVSVKQDGKEIGFSTGDEKLFLKLNGETSRGKTSTFAIRYSFSYPERGMYFRYKTSQTPWRKTQVWTQGEDADNRFWFPCYDFPNDKATSEVLVTIPDSLKALSNGKLIAKTPDKKRKVTTWHYRLDQPHSTYLVMLAIGDYSVVSAKAGKIPMSYWLYPDRIEEGKRGFSQTADMMKAFEQYTDMPYPWGSYSQVVIQDFMYGGMENTGATTMNDESINLDRFDIQDQQAEGLVAHELIHQWFGNVVTPRDWTHLWLNESFATFFETWYYRQKGWFEQVETDLFYNQMAGMYTDRQYGRKPIVSEQSYVNNLYPRGGAILYSLEYVLGRDAFREALRYYLKKHAFQPVQTSDLVMAIEESTGRNLDWFFNQWIYKAGFPDYRVLIDTTMSPGTLTVRILQEQEQDSLTGVFRMPLEFQVTGRSGEHMFRVENYTADTTYRFPVSQVFNVRMDPGNAIMKTVATQKPFGWWMYQIGGNTNLAGQIEAMVALSDSLHREEVQNAFRHLVETSRYAVCREESLGFLASSSDNPSPELLQSGLRDKKSDVRRTAMAFVSRLPDKKTAWELALKHFETDSSFSVRRTAASALTDLDSLKALTVFKSWIKKYPNEHRLIPTLLQKIGSYGIQRDFSFIEPFANPPCHREIRDAAFSAMKKLDSDNPALRTLWIEAVRSDSDEILRHYLLTDATSYRSAEVEALLFDLAKHEKIPLVSREVQVQLLRFGLSVNR